MKLTPTQFQSLWLSKLAGGSGYDGKYTTKDDTGPTNPKKKLYAEGMMGMALKGEGEPDGKQGKPPKADLPEHKMTERQKSEVPANEGKHSTYAKGPDMPDNHDHGKSDFKVGKVPKLAWDTTLYLCGVLEKMANSAMGYPAQGVPPQPPAPPPVPKVPNAGAAVPPTGPTVPPPPPTVAAAPPAPPSAIMQRPQTPGGNMAGGMGGGTPSSGMSTYAAERPQLRALFEKLSAGPLTPGGVAGARVGARVATPAGAQPGLSPEPVAPKGNAMRQPQAAAGGY